MKQARKRKRKRKGNTAWYHFYGKSKRVELMQTESKTAVAQGWVWGKQGDISQKVQTFSYKMIKF